MAVVVDKSDVDQFLKYANEENLEATVVAEVTEEPRLVLEWRGKEIVNLSRAFLDTTVHIRKQQLKLICLMKTRTSSTNSLLIM